MIGNQAPDINMDPLDSLDSARYWLQLSCGIISNEWITKRLLQEGLYQYFYVSLCYVYIPF